MCERWLENLAGREPLFVFDLDSTVTRCELLPRIAARLGMGEEMARLTERAMGEDIPFEQDFFMRAMRLKQLPLSQAREIAAQTPLNTAIAAFLRDHREKCVIVTGNLDVWIEDLIEKLGMRGRCLCSRAHIENGQLAGIEEVLDKEKTCQALNAPFVAVGDGSNDARMLRMAALGIAFGGVRKPPRVLIEAADLLIEDEEELVSLLKKLL